MNQYLENFLKYLADEQSKSSNTLEAYKRDILSFQKFLSYNGAYGLLDANNADIITYYYALFKGWLLLSQPPGCPDIVT